MRCPFCRNNSDYIIKLYSNIGECSICMNEFTDPVAFIKCGHIHCLECINKEASHRNELKPLIISDESIINNNYTSSNSSTQSTLNNSPTPNTLNRSSRSSLKCLRDTCPYPSWNNRPMQCCSKTCRNKKCIKSHCNHDKLGNSSYCITHFIQI